MPEFRFLNLPLETREEIYAAYVSSVHVGFDSRPDPGVAGSLEKWRYDSFNGSASRSRQPPEMRFEWCISLDNEQGVLPENTKAMNGPISNQNLGADASEVAARATANVVQQSRSKPSVVHRKIPGLLLASKQVYEELMTSIGQHKELRIPHRGPYLHRDLPVLERELQAQIPILFRTNVKHLVIEKILLPLTIDAIESEHLVEALVGMLPALKSITLIANEHLTHPGRGFNKPTGVAYGGPVSCKEVAKFLAQRKYELTTHPTHRQSGLPQNLTIFLDLRLTILHKGFCCDKPGRTVWVSCFRRQIHGDD